MFGLEQNPTKYGEPEKWYIAVDCAKCGEGIAIAETPTPIVQYRKIKGVRCPHCGHVAAYAPASMSCRQGPKIVHGAGSKSATG
jgi:DNA-directed RNA polymerase subunit RPC12/RpoP